jgi:hypothetical protein
MTTSLLVLLSAIMAPGWTNIRVDHQNLPTHTCYNCAIAVGSGAPSRQPIYVVFQDDSTMMGLRSDIWFQKSTDGGRTWLPADMLIRRGGYPFYPDITADPEGNVCIIYLEVDTASNDGIYCVRSSDGGTTWSAPARVNDDISSETIGGAKITADSAGNLLCAWNDWRTGNGRIWSSVSTDGGATWAQNVRVDDVPDSLFDSCYPRDVSVQPGTNQYLVTAEAPRLFGGNDVPCAFLYRSTDRGRTFHPGVQLDTFNCAAWSPHVVADRDHIICDYFGAGQLFSPMLAESRSFYSGPDTWGAPSAVATLDSLHSLYISGPLALSGDSRVHTALLICDTTDWHYDVCYTSSSDYGVSWSDFVRVDEDSTGNNWYPDIGADSAGHAYVVWEYFDGQRGYIWFATNNPLAIAEQPRVTECRCEFRAEPNPFMKNVTFILSVSAKRGTVARVYAQDGRLVRQTRIPAGEARWVWDGRDDSGTPLPPGVYVLEAGPGIRAKVVKLK